MESFIMTAIYILAAIYGLCVGSFLNVVIWRLPAGMKMTNDRSQCPKCHHLIHWYDNIPLLSYMVLRGKCRYCGEKISFRYPFNEALNMVLWVLSFVVFRENLVYAGVVALVCSIAICIFWIDYDCQYIYDRFIVLLLCLGIVALLTDTATVWYAHTIGAVFGGAVFWLTRFVVSKRVGAEALGLGDVKLATAMGMLLGWEKFLFCMLVTSVTACIILAVWRKREALEQNHAFPFGPFLAAGLVLSLFIGDAAISGYLRMLGL